MNSPPRQPTGAFLSRVLDRQVVRFAIVGVFNSAFGYGAFAGLEVTIGRHVHYLVVLLLSHIIGVLEAYLLQRWLVFQVRGRWWRELARFWSVYLVALAVNAVALPLLVEVARVAVLPAQAIIMLGTAFGSFFAHRNFTFRRGGIPASGSQGTEVGRSTGAHGGGPVAS